MKLITAATLVAVLPTAVTATPDLNCTNLVAQSCMEEPQCNFNYQTASCEEGSASLLLRGSTDKLLTTDKEKTAGLTSFVTLGDWGGAALEDYHKTDELAVAKTLGTSAESLNAQFLVNVGDNFYYYGVNSTTDSQWQTTFEDVYTQKSLSIPWYSILGNHDYGYNPAAQLQYKSPVNDRWVMPARYYTKRVEIGTSGNYISFVFLDASPCQAAYRSPDKSGWDPCGGDYPGPADCKFNANVLAQDCGKQLTWLQAQVKNIPANDWKIAVSHAPFDELDVEDLTAVLQASKFDMYLNGHVHNLALYSLDSDGGTYVQSGAGCMVEIKSDLEKIKMNPQVRDKHAEYRAKVELSGVGHTYHSLWEQKIAGFTTHTFSSDFSNITTTFVDNNGNKIHTVVTSKGAKPIPPTPPGPSPSPTGKCCYSSSSTCSAGDTCCKASCNDTSTCSYTQRGCEGEYGQKHNCQWTGKTCVVGSSKNDLDLLTTL